MDQRTQAMVVSSLMSGSHSGAVYALRSGLSSVCCSRACPLYPMGYSVPASIELRQTEHFERWLRKLKDVRPARAFECASIAWLWDSRARSKELGAASPSSESTTARAIGFTSLAEVER